jgi:hypothetical protein
VAPITRPSPTLHSLRAGHTIHKDHSKPSLEENDRESGGENKKIKLKILYNKHYWAIQYMNDLKMDGNILYLIESTKELLPGYIKTSRGLILPREIYYALTNIKGLEKEIGVVKKEKSKLRHILGIEHGNIPIELDLWGNEVIFREKDRQHYTDTQGQRHEPEDEFYAKSLRLLTHACRCL